MELENILGKYFGKQKNIDYILSKTSGEFQHEEIYELMCLIKKYGLDKGIEHLKNRELIWKNPLFKEEEAKIKEENDFMVIPYEISEGVLECKKCSCKKIFSFSKQTRGLDEPTTIFALCSKCGTKWCEGS